MAATFWKTSGHTILITGGGSGIGLAFAKRLAARGNKVIVVGRRQSQLEIVKSELGAIDTIQGDVSSENSRIALVKSVVARFPSLNVVINNAGIQNRLPSPGGS